MKLANTFTSALMLIAVSFLTPISAQAASQCNNTAWQPSNGRTCANTGLNSNKAICTGGNFAVYCDDTRSEIRTCLSNIRCNGQQSQPSFSFPSYNNNSGFGYPQFNYGNQGNNDYEVYRGKRFHCTDWDYKKRRPCKSGKFNEDCRGTCQ